MSPLRDLCLITFLLAALLALHTVDSPPAAASPPSQLRGTASSSSTSPTSSSLSSSQLAQLCDAAQAEAQAQHLRASDSSCPTGEWWPQLKVSGLSCRDLLLVNIGANKGYKLAAWVDLLRPELHVSPRTLYAALTADSTRKFEDMGGTCYDYLDASAPALASSQCETSGSSSSGSSGSSGRAAAGEELQGRQPEAQAGHRVHLHAFEPLPGNVDVLREGMESLLASAGPGISLQVHAAAMVGNPALTEIGFGPCAAGNERCGVDSGVGSTGGPGDGELARGQVVAATTVDAWLAQEPSLSGQRAQGAPLTVDVLAIDAEGHDPEVLKGAEGLLSRGGARILEFEYHHLREWGVTSLQSVLQRLDAWGYDCFLLQRKGRVLRLTGCWHSSYEFKAWSNVMCVHRREAGMVAVMNGFTSLFEEGA